MTLFLPFIYFILAITTYEVLFIDLNFGYKKSNELKRYAKREIIKYCRLNLKKVGEASNNRIYNLMQIRNEDDVDKMIKALKPELMQ